jgi:endonuclease YncB( thermonuclease family)
VITNSARLEMLRFTALGLRAADRGTRSPVRTWVLAAAWLLLPCSAGAHTEQPISSAKVVAYGSGSAFAVLDANAKLRRVKLTGVDAPERRQRFAPEARRLAAEWLGARPIDIAVDGIGKDQRVHGRVIVDGKDVGLVLIEAGLAWCDPNDAQQLPETVRLTYRQACDKAKSSRQGLWQDANPTPPWEYRRIPEFDPPPAEKKAEAARTCRQIGYETLVCDDGESYRALGSQVIGSDGTIYSRRGQTVTGTDGSRFEQQGKSIYGNDGSVCRTRGRRIDCY